MTRYEPARLDRFSLPNLALRQARSDARKLADRRWAAVEKRLRDEGAADRRVLGIPEPEQPWRPANAMQAWGAAAAIFNDAIAQMGRDLSIGLARGKQ
jgi:hypothetical protein